MSFTLIDDDRVLELPVTETGGRVLLSNEALRETLGFELRPEGLCRGAHCIPLPDREALTTPGGIDLEALADALGRPLVLDSEEGIAVLGTAALDRAAALAGLEAPEFTLPDLEGRLHSLSEQREHKVLLVTWASW